MKSIIKIGAQLCKQNTKKLSSLNNVEIMYAQLKNVTKTSIPGAVTVVNSKKIKC